MGARGEWDQWILGLLAANELDWNNLVLPQSRTLHLISPRGDLSYCDYQYGEQLRARANLRPLVFLYRCRGAMEAKNHPFYERCRIATMQHGNKKRGRGWKMVEWCRASLLMLCPRQVRQASFQSARCRAGKRPACHVAAFPPTESYGRLASGADLGQFSSRGNL